MGPAGRIIQDRPLVGLVDVAGSPFYKKEKVIIF